MSTRTRRRKEAQRRERQQAQSPNTPSLQFIINASDGWPLTDVLDQISGPGHVIDVISPAPREPGAYRVTVDQNPTAGRTKAAARGNAPYLIFLDCDALLDEPEMVNIALAHLSTGAAVVGPLLVDAMGRTFGAGYTFSINGRPYPRFRGWASDHPKVTQPREVQAVPFVWLATTRDAWRRAGAISPLWGAYPFSEADYSLRAARFGRVVYEPAIRVMTGGQMIPQQGIETGVQMLLSQHRPAYDEWALL